MPTIFVTAASGHIGSKLIPLLVETEDNKLVLPTSNSARLTSSLPKSESIIVVEGSIQDPQWVETQLRTHNVDTVFLCLTGTDELFTTMNIFSALQRTPSMKHIVYLSACGDFTLSSQGLRGWKAAHAIVKCPIEMVLRDLSSEMGFTYTILGPTLFFDNDLRQKGAILNGGVYPEPLGTKGASRVSTDDIADAVRIAALDQGRKWNGKKIALGSRKRYTEDDISALWTDALGKPVKSASIDDSGLDNLEGHFRTVVDPAWARDLRLMYEGIRANGFGPTDEEYAEQVAFMGREPQSYDGFVRDLASGWKA